MNPDRMLAQLALHEGIVLRVYLDTEGYATLGIGYNISARGLDFFEHTIGRVLPALDQIRISRQEACQVCTADITRIESAVKAHWPFYRTLDAVRQRVAVDMAFNMGWKAAGFKHTIAAIERQDWPAAVQGLHDSKWARQVKGRADRLARMLLTGAEPTDIPSL